MLTLKINLDMEVFGMNKVLKKVGLSAVVATFVFGLASTSSALIPLDPDNETAILGTHTSVLVKATDNAEYSENESYSMKIDNASVLNNFGNGNGGTTQVGKLDYSKSYLATNGETHVVSSFDAQGAATSSKPNIKADNKITYYTSPTALGGTFVGSEKVGYRACNCVLNGNQKTLCGAANVGIIPPSHADLAAGGKFNVTLANIHSQADATVAAYYDNKTNIIPLEPNMAYSIDAGGVEGIDNRANGSMEAKILASVSEHVANPATSPATTTTNYSQDTTVSGRFKFSKAMKYQSKINTANIPMSNNFDGLFK